MSIEKTKGVLCKLPDFAKEMVQVFEEHKMPEYDKWFTELEVTEYNRYIWEWQTPEGIVFSLSVYPAHIAFRVRISKWTTWREESVTIDKLSDGISELRGWFLLNVSHPSMRKNHEKTV